MVKYRDFRRLPRGRGTVLQDSARMLVKIGRDIREERSLQKIRTAGNADQIFNALGLPIRRAMLRRLRVGGAMSVSKLGQPYNISLPATFKHVRILEESGLVVTEKRGRVRICIYNPSAFKELAQILSSRAAFREGSFARLERQVSNYKSMPKKKK